MNTNIIEIIGPPGVGKSTIYKTLCKTWSPESNWIYPDMLLAPKPNLFEVNRWIKYKFRNFYTNKITKEIPVDYGLRFAKNNEELANFLWNHLSNEQVYSHKEIHKRFRSAYFLFANFCKYQAIMECSFTKPCIIQEGFLQKSFFVNDDEQLVNESLNRYLPLLPLPRAIIYINTSDSKVIVERLSKRKKIIASQFGKDNKALLVDIKKWQHTMDLILEKAKMYNVSILEVNGEKPVSENVSRINKMMEKMT